ncbi:MAG: 3'-5' exonuclease [Kiritimatiellae bacterium]|nr:3'-5' exonuclease [Kiritimatiellia bacterium]
MKNLTITILDFETTGTLPGFPCEPWQIGMVQWSEGVIGQDFFESLLRIGDRPFNPMAPGNHHALRPQLKVAPTFQELWPQLVPWLHGVILCAHNIATEKNILNQQAPLHYFGPWIDTLKLSRAAWPDAPSHKLEELTLALNLRDEADAFCPNREPHDALYDAVCCALLLKTILNLPGWKETPLESLLLHREKG